jgi:hypothetical protein
MRRASRAVAQAVATPTRAKTSLAAGTTWDGRESPRPRNSSSSPATRPGSAQVRSPSRNSSGNQPRPQTSRCAGSSDW